MPDVTFSHPSGLNVTVQNAQVNDTGTYVRVDKAGIKAELDTEMSKVSEEESFSVEVGGAVTMGLKYDNGTTTDDSISFTKDG